MEITEFLKLINDGTTIIKPADKSFYWTLWNLIIPLVPDVH